MCTTKPKRHVTVNRKNILTKSYSILCVVCCECKENVRTGASLAVTYLLGFVLRTRWANDKRPKMLSIQLFSYVLLQYLDAACSLLKF